MHNNIINRGYNVSSRVAVMNLNGGESDPNYPRASGITQATRPYFPGQGFSPLEYPLGLIQLGIPTAVLDVAWNAHCSTEFPVSA